MTATIEQMLSSLNEKQLEAVNYNDGPCLIIAGAGTGKTKTLTTKIAKLIADGMNPARILAVTFTNKAAQEMRQRIDSLVPGGARSVWIHTFHSFAVRILRQHAEVLKLNRDFVIYDESEQKKIVSLVLEELGVKEAKKEAQYYVSCISRAKDDMLTPEDFMAQAVSSNIDKKIQIAEVYKRYQKKLDTAGALDFGDLLMKVVFLLKNNQEICEYYQNYFQYILVDEYQDTNETQYFLTKKLALKHRHLCVVGDPDQSIYSWRGANIRNILEFEKDFKDAKVITLEQNYRSTQVILDAANKLIKKNKNRREKNLFSQKSSGDPITVRELASEGEEARYTAMQINNLVEEGNASLNDIAVFYRTNAQSRSFEDTFRRYQIPYRLIGAVKFYDRKEIKDVLAYAKVLVNPMDTVSLLRIINTPRRALGETAQQALVNAANAAGTSLYTALKSAAFIENLKPTARRGAKEFVDLIEGLTLEMQMSSPSEILTKVLELSGYQKSIEAELEKDPEAASRIGNLNELINAVKEYEDRCRHQETAPTLSGYLQEVSLISGADEGGNDTQNGAVTLMTVHLAKGLEFPIVFVSGLEEGLFPLSGKDDDDLEEERRLCYVAMTRAKSTLYMTYTTTRRIFGKTYSNLASRFLFDSGLIEPASYSGPMERSEIAPNRGRFNRWTSNNSVSYNNASKYRKTFEEFGIDLQNEYAEQTYKPSTSYQTSQSESAPTASAASGGARVGSRVKHGVFGIGKIVSLSGSGEATKITVIFTNGTKRVFMLKYAPLEIL